MGLLDKLYTFCSTQVAWYGWFFMMVICENNSNSYTVFMVMPCKFSFWELWREIGDVAGDAHGNAGFFSHFRFFQGNSINRQFTKVIAVVSPGLVVFFLCQTNRVKTDKGELL